jgi:catechol 2,3-dioxygenase-like lactoylglutathione lyase family enzyme
LIGYVTLGTNNVSRAADFYDAVLAEIGAIRSREHEKYIAWQVGPGQPQLLLIDPYDGNDASVGNGTMVGLRAGSSERVRAAFERAIALGGKDEGSPGLRKSPPGFYAAYIRDLDGNKLVFYCMGEVSPPCE